VRNFILESKTNNPQRGASGKKPKGIPQYTHFPSRVYLEFDAIDWSKVLPKTAECNRAVAASTDPHTAALAMLPAEEEMLKTASDILSDARRFHGSTMPRSIVKLLYAKPFKWPLSQQLAVVDTLRVLVTHPDGAEAVAEVAGANYMTGELARLQQSLPDPALRPVALLTLRGLFNALRNAPLRKLQLARADDLIDILASVVRHDHATIKFAGSALILNLAHAFLQQQKNAIASAQPGVGSAADNAADSQGPNAVHVQKLITLLASAMEQAPDTNAAFNLVVALGTCVLTAPQFLSFAKSVGFPQKATSMVNRFPSAEIREAMGEMDMIFV
jgi:hypothetical protein